MCSWTQKCHNEDNKNTVDEIVNKLQNKSSEEFTNKCHNEDNKNTSS